MELGLEFCKIVGTNIVLPNKSFNEYQHHQKIHFLIKNKIYFIQSFIIDCQKKNSGKIENVFFKPTKKYLMTMIIIPEWKIKLKLIMIFER